jgi:hypothetical protein
MTFSEIYESVDEDLWPQELCPCCDIGLNEELNNENTEFADKRKMWLIYEENKKKVKLRAIATKICKFWLLEFVSTLSEDSSEMDRKMYKKWPVDMVENHLRRHIIDEEMHVINDVDNLDKWVKVLWATATITDVSTGRKLVNVQNLKSAGTYLKLKHDLVRASSRSLTGNGPKRIKS